VPEFEVAHLVADLVVHDAGARPYSDEPGQGNEFGRKVSVKLDHDSNSIMATPGSVR
jgi:hypothetical protein